MKCDDKECGNYNNNRKNGCENIYIKPEECPSKPPLIAKTKPVAKLQFERGVIRQLLEDEAESLYRSSERHRLAEAMDAASYDNAVREGITRALFLLNLKLGV